MTKDCNLEYSDRIIQLEAINKSLVHTEAVLNTLLSRICSDFAQVNPVTKQATIKRLLSQTSTVMSYEDSIITLAKSTVSENEFDRYLEVYNFDTIYNYLKENDGFHAAVFEGKAGDGRNYIVINSFLIKNELDGTEQMFSYSQDISEIESLKKEKKYSEGLVSNKLMTYEANLTKDLMIYSAPEWLKSTKAEYTDVFSKLITSVCNDIISPDFRDYLNATVNREYLLNSHNNGKNLITIEYKKRVDDCRYEWFEQTLNIITDEKTGDIVLRCYTININERKERELQIIGDKQRYESMFAKAISVYEINITKNVTLKGHEEWPTLFGIRSTDDYTELITALARKTIHNDDRDKFLTVFSRQAIIENFKNGVHELSCEYRRINDDGDFLWYRCTMHTFIDLMNGDLRAFSYVEDINDEKKKELNLIYRSEHDMLTGLYNKMTAQEKIEEFLASNELKTSKHALLMVDLDCFKDINDSFGHAFGDAVLSGVGLKMRTLFRDDDIIGRIGGDEFIILMKNVSTERVIAMKAQEICDILRENYHYDSKDYEISASVGVSLYPKHGKHYRELYKNSDTALYYSKCHGRNMYSFYNDSMGEAETNIKDIDRDRLVVISDYDRHNISQHIFRILYESPNKYTAINSVLEFVGKHYKFSRTYVFENTPDNNFVKNTFEWCAENIESQMTNLQNVAYAYLGDYESNFNADGVFYMPDVRMVNSGIKEILEPQEVKSMVQVSIVKNGEFIGFVGFDFCDNYAILDENELLEYKTVANIITVFIAEMRIMQENEEAKQTALSIVNGLESYAYVCDPKTYKILFINEKALSIASDSKVGDYCYEAFWGRNEPCYSCPMREIQEKNIEKHCCEMHNTKFDVWVKVTTTLINWLGEKKVCLVDSVDITEYKIPLIKKEQS